MISVKEGDVVMWLIVGGKRRGRNEVFWEHQGEALITWGYGAAVICCKKERD